MKYRASHTSSSFCLRQGELISNIIHARLNLASIDEKPIVDFTVHPFAILMTQDCDLEQDFAVRLKLETSDKLLPSLLFCEVATAEELSGIVATNLKEWRNLKISSNKNERFQFLQQVDASCDAQQIGVEELGIDFKRCFTIPTDEVYRRIEIGQAKRRCVPNSPYLEHLSSRFAYYLSRVALPEDHSST